MLSAVFRDFHILSYPLLAAAAQPPTSFNHSRATETSRITGQSAQHTKDICASKLYPALESKPRRIAAISQAAQDAIDGIALLSHVVSGVHAHVVRG